MIKIFPNQINKDLEIIDREKFFKSFKREFELENQFKAKMIHVEGQLESGDFIISALSTQKNFARAFIHVLVQERKVTIEIVPSKWILLLPIFLILINIVVIIQLGISGILLSIPIGIVFFYLMSWLAFSFSLSTQKWILSKLEQACA